MESKRIWELDFLRGLSIILMVFDHFMYDMGTLNYWFSNFFAVDNKVMNFLREAGLWYWDSWLRNSFHFVFVAIFLLVSGISFHFSKNNFKRGLKFFGVAMLISFVTLSVEYYTGLNIGIVFGIIHMFAVGTLITVLVRKLIHNEYVILLIGAAIVAYGLMFQFWDVPYVPTLTFQNFWEVVIGSTGYGADHFGIFPYTGVILIGTVIGSFFYKPRKSLVPRLEGGYAKPFMWAGRNTLWIFITHQLILMALIYAVGFLLGYKI